MKTSSASSEDSMSTKSCSVQLRILTLVINTANFINERTTPTLGVSHALLAPVALFTTYIFMGIFVLGAIRKNNIGWFLQIYGLVACISVEITLSFTVFKELGQAVYIKKHAAMTLNGILPLANTVIMVIDLIVFMFSEREVIAACPDIDTSLP